MNIKIVGSFLLGISTLFGGEMIIDSPKEITAAWEQKVFGIKYGITTLDNAVDEMVDGLIDDTFDTNFIQRIKTEIEKHPTGVGEYVEYWKNGSIKARLPYKNGKANGHLHGWYDNKRDAFKGYFKEGTKQGIHITFFRTEPKEFMKNARILTYTEKGKLDTKQYRSHSNGELWIVIFYRNGIAHGVLEGWDFPGKYFLAAQYKKGILQKKPPLPPEERSRPKPRIDGQYVDEVIYEFIKIAKKEFGVDPCGTGARMAFDVEKIRVDFNISKKGTIKEGRELIIKLTEKLTKLMNEHEKLRPYLREYPCTSDRADVSFSFCDNRGQMNKDGSISRVLVGKGNKIYYGISRMNQRLIKNEFIEPYNEAKKLVFSKKE